MIWDVNVTLTLFKEARLMAHEAGRTADRTDARHASRLRRRTPSRTLHSGRLQRRLKHTSDSVPTVLGHNPHLPRIPRPALPLEPATASPLNASMTGGFSGIPVAEEGGTPQGPHLAGVAQILAPRWAKFPAITVGLLGVQVFWSVEMSYGAYATPLASVPRRLLCPLHPGTPYLLSLGLSKATVAIVFLAGPISGLVVQPLIGAPLS